MSVKIISERTISPEIECFFENRPGGVTELPFQGTRILPALPRPSRRLSSASWQDDGA